MEEAFFWYISIYSASPQNYTLICIIAVHMYTFAARQPKELFNLAISKIIIFWRRHSVSSLHGEFKHRLPLPRLWLPPRFRWRTQGKVPPSELWGSVYNVGQLCRPLRDGAAPVVHRFCLHILLLYCLVIFIYLAASQILARHEFLVATIGVTDEEILSYTVAYYLPIGLTVAVLTTSLLAVLTFLLYNYRVRGGGELKYFQEYLNCLLFSSTRGAVWSKTK